MLILLLQILPRAFGRPLVVRVYPFLIVALFGIGCGSVFGQDLPAVAAARFSNGVASLKAGELDAAEKAFRDVIRNGGDRAFVHHNLGIVEQQRGRHEAALAEFRTASRMDPTFAPARLLAGASLLALARPRDAIAELQAAARLSPTETAPHLQLAQAYEQLGDMPRLADEYRRIVQLAPGEPEYAYRLGAAHLKLAEWALGRARRVDPQAPRLAQALADEYRTQGRLGEALKLLEGAVRRAPARPEIHLALARVYADQGRWTEALDAVRAELALVPESRAAREMESELTTRK